MEDVSVILYKIKMFSVQYKCYLNDFCLVFTMYSSLISHFLRASVAVKFFWLPPVFFVYNHFNCRKKNSFFSFFQWNITYLNALSALWKVFLSYEIMLPFSSGSAIIGQLLILLIAASVTSKLCVRFDLKE